jgi:hypothetical protein
MERLKFNVTINAPREKVWDVLWKDETYRAWTSAFNEGSHVKTDWKEGSKVLFLDGNGDGMVSTIARSIPNEYMSFEHLGVIVNGVEDTTSEKVRNWAGAMENYTLKTAGGKTELSVDIDIDKEHKDMFTQIFPKALDNVKRLAETN